MYIYVYTFLYDTYLLLKNQAQLLAHAPLLCMASDIRFYLYTAKIFFTHQVFKAQMI